MNCKQIREQLVEAARGRELSTDLRKIVFSHASVCVGCAQRLDGERRLSNALSELALSGNGAPARMEQLILKRLPVVPISRTNRKPWLWPGVAAAAAALFIAALALRPPVTNGVVPPVVPSKVAPDIARNAPPEVAAVTPKLQPSLAAPAISEIESDSFVPLPYAPELALNEQAEMVRVEMPPEALRAMGVPVYGDNGGDQIEADILLGMDGTARAIRFVN
jgi:hypothetical protein